MMSKVKASNTSKRRCAFQDFLMKTVRSRFAVSFWGISRLGSAFITLRWFKLTHICIQVSTGLHKGDWAEYISRRFYRKSISRNITHLQFSNVQAMLTGETLEDQSESRESKQTQD